MSRSLPVVLAVVVLPFADGSPGRADTIWFTGYEWEVRQAHGAPGPNWWDAGNVWVDADGDLHLRITYKNGRWTCAEVQLTEALGFGTYEFQVVGRLDQLDANVILGLFNYGGTDGVNEIDIEFGQWGNPNADRGHYTVYPAQPGHPETTELFPVALDGPITTHRFLWAPDQVAFESVADDDLTEFGTGSSSPATRRCSSRKRQRRCT
jgi:hypothetical protein